MVQILFCVPLVRAMLPPLGFMRMSTGAMGVAFPAISVPGPSGGARRRTLPTPMSTPLLRPSRLEGNNEKEHAIECTLQSSLHGDYPPPASPNPPTNIVCASVHVSVRVLRSHSGFWSITIGTDERDGWVGLSTICFP
jgi:hypothetical protein